jgi:hypothetical protein
MGGRGDAAVHRPDHPTPARRGPLDAIFDTVVFNSALLPESRHWWQRLHPKGTWKLLTMGTLAAWAYAVVTFPSWD